jgi:hypothetical protein
LKNKYLLSVIAVVLASLMVSTATVPAAAILVTHGWHRDTITGERGGYFGIDDWQFTKTGETIRYEYYIEKFIFKQTDDIYLTLTERHDKTKSWDTGWTILSMSYQDTCLHLSFIGMKGTVHGENGVDDLYMWIYDFSGLGVGSYGPGSHFGDAFVRGTIHLQASDLDGSYFIAFNFAVTYYV